MSGEVRLTEDEREAIENAWIISPKDGPSGDDDPMYAAVERILAARLASAAADREAIERARALADEWERTTLTVRPVFLVCADELRAALSVPTEAEGTS